MRNLNKERVIMSVPEFTKEQIEAWVSSNGYVYEDEYQSLYNEYGDALNLWSMWIRQKAVEKLTEEWEELSKEDWEEENEEGL